MAEGAVAAESARRTRTRERLMDAAFAVFAEVGVAGASVEQIAERAGFTRGAFYSNFSSKEELFLALMERGNAAWLARLEARVEQVLPDSGEPTVIDEAVIGDMVTAVLTAPFDIKHWGLVQTEFRLLALRDPELAQSFAEHHRRFEDSLAPILVESVRRAGRRLRLDPVTMARLLMAYYKEAVEDALLGSPDLVTALAAAHAAMAGVIDALTEPA